MARWTQEEREQFSNFINEVLYEKLTTQDYYNIMRKLGAENRGDRFRTICHNIDGGGFNLAFNEEDRYFNIEFNPNGCMFLGLGVSDISRHTRLIADPKELFDIKVNFTNDGWEVFYKIPVEFIQRFFPEFTLESGKKIRANLYKCGDECVQPHYFSWCQVVPLPASSFHNPKIFGEMIFE